MPKQKQFSKLSRQKAEQLEESLFKEYEYIIHHVGVWVFALSVLIGSIQLTHQKVAVVKDHGALHAEVGDHMARGQGERETARLPEEFDVGLRAPSISGY